MHKHSLFCRAAALVLTLALTAALALPGFAAAYAMPIQTAYDAEAVYLFDASTGEALVEQNPDQVRPIASLTKMMTALLVLESGADLNESIPIPDSLTPEFRAIRANRGHHHRPAGRGERPPPRHALRHAGAQRQRRGQRAGQRRRRGDLAAFAARMNARASQLGCTNTHFTCPHGLYDNNNYSTARDMAKIALACHANGTYMQVANTVSYTLPATNLHPARNISSTNRLLEPGGAPPPPPAAGGGPPPPPPGRRLGPLAPPTGPPPPPAPFPPHPPNNLPRSRRAVRLGVLKPRPAAQGGGP